jgi:hypothetical protein
MQPLRSVSPFPIATGMTRKEIQPYTGPRGGKYHYSSSGHKVYERRRR